MPRPSRSLLTFFASVLTLVIAISITSAAPIAASGELTRPVTVANTQLPVNDIKNSVANRIQVQCFVTIAPGFVSGTTSNCPIAAGGTRLQVQELVVNGVPGIIEADCVMTAANDQVQVLIPITTDPAGRTFGSLALTAYVDGGVLGLNSCNATRTGSSRTSNVIIHVIGYQVPVP